MFSGVKKQNAWVGVSGRRDLHCENLTGASTLVCALSTLSALRNLAYQYIPSARLLTRFSQLNLNILRAKMSFTSYIFPQCQVQNIVTVSKSLVISHLSWSHLSLSHLPPISTYVKQPVNFCFFPISLSRTLTISMWMSYKLNMCKTDLTVE